MAMGVELVRKTRGCLCSGIHRGVDVAGAHRAARCIDHSESAPSGGGNLEGNQQALREIDQQTKQGNQQKPDKKQSTHISLVTNGRSETVVPFHALR
jgi:hypothetical protein